MKVPYPPRSQACQSVLDRIAEIKARFRRPGGAFASVYHGALAEIPSREVGEAVASAAARHGVDPALLSALVQVESGFRTDAVSRAGAVGIAQLMPATARSLGVRDPFDLWANLEGGARYLREQLDRFGGDLALALAAYNAGPAAVARHGGVPPYAETRRFVSRVLELLPGNQP